LLSEQIWKDAKPDIPNWVFAAFLLAMGVFPPILWILKKPRVYEVAVSGSQFFFIGGIYWTYLMLRRQNFKAGKLFIIGLHWAFSFASRLTALPVIGVAMLGILLHIYSQQENKKQIFVTAKKIIVPLLGPVLIMLAGLALYNFKRFGTVLETGLTYQLTSTDYTTGQTFFSVANIKGNFFNYFLYPIKTNTEFPFITPTEHIFSNERMAGIFFIVPLIYLLTLAFRWLNPTVLKNKTREAKTFAAILFMSSLLFTTIILIYYFPGTRFILEFMPLLFLCILISLPKTPSLLKTIPALYHALIAFLAIASSTLSIMIAC